MRFVVDCVWVAVVVVMALSEKGVAGGWMMVREICVWLNVAAVVVVMVCPWKDDVSSN